MPSYLIEMQHSFFHNTQKCPIIAGVDEVGYGAWAGPLVIAAVVLDIQQFPKEVCDLLDDSKKLTKFKRQKIYDYMKTEQNKSCWFNITIISPSIIDAINVLNANMHGIHSCVEGLAPKPSVVLVDGVHVPKEHHPNTTYVPIKSGDSISNSIAAASIIAKVTRDNIMIELHKTYPFYSWDTNVGYGTKKHIHGISTHGITLHHRKSYKPIQNIN